MKGLFGRKAFEPVNSYPVAGSIVIPANGFGIVRLGGPDQRNFWNVQRIVVGGLSPVVPVAGQANIYVTPMDLRNYQDFSSMGLADWRDRLDLPGIATYGNNQMFLRLNEELFIVFSGCTPGQQYVTVAYVQNAEESARRQEVYL